MKREIHYLNTDLDLVSPSDLTPLAQALTARGLVALHIEEREDGCWSATFETEEQFREPDPNIAAMLGIIESLDEV